MIKVKTIGLGVLAVGVVMLFYSLMLDTSVYVEPRTYGEGEYRYTTEPKWVHNIGLMNEKQNWLIFSSVVCIAGLLVFLLGKGTVGTPEESEENIEEEVESEDEIPEEHSGNKNVP